MLLENECKKTVKIVIGQCFYEDMYILNDTFAPRFFLNFNKHDFRYEIHIKLRFKPSGL